MAAARNTTGETDIRRKLDEYVDAHLTRHMYDTDESWPLRKTIRLPKQAELEQHYNQIRAQNETIRDWARQHHCETSEKTKIVSSGLITKKPAHRLRDHTRPRHRPPHRHQTNPRTLPTRTRPHERARQRIRPRTGERHERRQNPQRPRRHRLPPRHPSRPLLRKPRLPHHDPRMAPIPGFSAKWLGAPNSQRRKAICQLTGQDNLTFQERPNELRLRSWTPNTTTTDSSSPNHGSATSQPTSNTPSSSKTKTPTRPCPPSNTPSASSATDTPQHHTSQHSCHAHHHPNIIYWATWTPTDSTSSPNYAPPASHAHPY